MIVPIALAIAMTVRRFEKTMLANMDATDVWSMVFPRPTRPLRFRNLQSIHPAITLYEMRHVIMAINELDMEGNGAMRFEDLLQALRLVEVFRSRSTSGRKEAWVLEEYNEFTQEDITSRFLRDPTSKRLYTAVGDDFWPQVIGCMIVRGAGMKASLFPERYTLFQVQLR